MRITPVLASNGDIGSYLAIKRDVTEQRAAEETQRLLAAIVESSKDAIVAYSATGTILSWNRGAEAISGYTAGEVIGKHVSILVPSERQHELAHLSERVLQGIAVPQFECLCQREDGRKIDMSVTACPIRNSSGDVAAISTILRDISERREAERSRGLLASIVESSDDAIHSVSLDGTILTWNRGAEEMFGYSSQEIIGHPPGGGAVSISGLTTTANQEVLAGLRGHPRNCSVIVT